MQRFQRILVSVAGDHAESAAVERAASLARHTGATLKLIDVDEGFPWYARLASSDAGKLHETIIQQKTARLESLVESLRRGGLQATAELLHGRPDLETVREVLRGGHDLVLKDAEASERGLFTSSDMQLLRNGPCPVWLVRPAPAARPRARILAAVDPTPIPDETDVLHLRMGTRTHNDELNDKILGLAIALATWEDGELHVVHAWDAPGEFLLRKQGLDPEQVDGYVKDMREASRQALDRLLAPFRDRIDEDRVHLVRGAPGEAIPRFAAAEGADLIIMGTVARTGIAGLVIGNTAETILQRVRCSVLAVKPEGFVSPVALGGGARHRSTVAKPMKTLQSILLATDFRPASQAAAQAAARLASVFGARVTALHVLAPMPEWPVALHTLTEGAEAALQTVRRELSGSGEIVTDTLVEVGPVADTIIRKAQAMSADLIVMGAGEWSVFDRFSVGPVAEAVLQRATLPVLAARPGEPSIAFRTILCPVDQSRTSKRGLENAIRLARAFGGHLVVLSVVPEAGWLTAAAQTGRLAGAPEQYEQKWRAEFEQMLAGIDFEGVSWEREVRTGSVHEAINMAARDHRADLIVMGSIGRSGLARVLLGSVTRRMLQQLPCSLLVVRDEDLLGELYEEDLQAVQRFVAEGRALLAAGSAAEALAKFREVLARHPYHVAALEGQAEACAMLGQPEEASRWRRRAEAVRDPS